VQVQIQIQVHIQSSIRSKGLGT